MKGSRHAILAPLLAVVALLWGLAGAASAAFNPAANNPHYGNYLLQQSEASASEWLQLADPTGGNGEWIYDSALGVPVYVMQNPWSGFDPEGLSTFGTGPMNGGNPKYTDPIGRANAAGRVLNSPEGSLWADFMPVVGTTKGATEVFRGKDLLTNRKLTGGERTLAGIGTVASLLPFGKAAVRGVGKLFGIVKHADEAVVLVDSARKIAEDQKMIDKLVDARVDKVAELGDKSGNATLAVGRSGDGALTEVMESMPGGVHAEPQVLEALAGTPKPHTVAVDQLPCGTCKPQLQEAQVRVIVPNAPQKPTLSPKSAAEKAARGDSSFKPTPREVGL